MKNGTDHNEEKQLQMMKKLVIITMNMAII